MNGSLLKEDEVAEVLMELAEANLLDHAEGCDVKRDDSGWYISVISLKPEMVEIPDEYKGVRFKVERPPGMRGHVGHPKNVPVRGETPLIKPEEAVLLD